MKWISHIAIGAAMALPFEPRLIPVAVLGATAPDWLEYVCARVGQPVKHRTVTHYLVLWLGFIAWGWWVWDWQGIIMWFGIGGLTHVLADSLTVTGIKVAPWSDQRFHLFGGRVRNGDSSEYLIAFGILGGGIVLAQLIGNNPSAFSPYFYPWSDYYEQGLLDGSEWKQNRWRWL